MTEVPDKNLELLSFALGTEFNECSIAAAELGKLAHSTLETDSAHRRTLYSIDHETVGQDFDFVDLDFTLMKSGTPENFSLALAKPHTNRIGKMSVLGRIMDRSVDMAGKEPMLVAILGKDTYIPLASFARRSGGTCSYVQIGTEMHDDNLFVTTADEGTSRQDIIELIRDVINKTEGSKPALLNQLLESELEDQTEQLDRAKEAQVVRLAYKQIATNTRQRKLKTIIEHTNEIGQSSMSTKSLTWDMELGDGRTSSIYLAEADQNTLQLLVVVREDLALTIASIDRSTGILTFPGLAQELSADKRRSAVSYLYRILAKDKSIQRQVFEHTEFRRVERSRQILAIARHLSRLGLIELREYGRHPRSDRIKPNRADARKVRQNINEYFTDPTLPRPYDSGILDSALNSLKSLNSVGNDLTASLSVKERLEEVIGPTTTQEEHLLGKIRSMAKGEVSFRAIARNVRLGKTVGDANIEAKIQRDGTFFSVIVSGAPLAMENEHPRPVFNVVFDYTKPLFDRTKFSEEEITIRAKEILDILELF